MATAILYENIETYIRVCVCMCGCLGKCRRTQKWPMNNIITQNLRNSWQFIISSPLPRSKYFTTKWWISSKIYKHSGQETCIHSVHISLKSHLKSSNCIEKSKELFSTYIIKESWITKRVIICIFDGVRQSVQRQKQLNVSDFSRRTRIWIWPFSRYENYSD